MFVAYINIHFFVLLSSIPLCGHTTACSLIHQLKDMWVVSSLEQLQIKLLQTFVSIMFLCEHMPSFHLFLILRRNELAGKNMANFH